MSNYEARQQARRERLEARAERLQAEGQARVDEASKMASLIPFGQPILIGHYSEKGDRAFRGRIRSGFDKGYGAMREAEAVQARADAVGSGGISSDDPEAVAKLQVQLAELEARHDAMKTRNKAERGSIEPWQLSNSSANIRRVKARIETLQKAATRKTKEIRREGYRVVQNVEANRIQIFFPGKPDEATRTKLKSNGFRWAPSEGAWQRQLNNAGVYAAQCILREIP